MKSARMSVAISAGIAALLLAFGFSSPSWAQVKDCEELKKEIDQKLRAKGVSDSRLTIVGIHEDHAGKVVGTCDGGTKRIFYERTAPPAPAPGAAAGAPAQKPGQH